MNSSPCTLRCSKKSKMKHEIITLHTKHQDDKVSWEYARKIHAHIGLLTHFIYYRKFIKLLLIFNHHIDVIIEQDIGTQKTHHMFKKLSLLGVFC